MSFSKSMEDAWTNGLKVGIERAGYTAQRADSTPHNERIDQKIVADIRTAQFIVADVTEQKSGVYFEAGLAIGFGKQVIWCVRKDDLKNVHFDTRQFAHIEWTDYEQLASELKSFIVAIIGQGPVIQRV